jgi:hypothetical protein
MLKAGASSSTLTRSSAQEFRSESTCHEQAEQWLHNWLPKYVPNIQQRAVSAGQLKNNSNNKPRHEKEH